MDFRQLEYIIEIARENNISRAAKNLFISQSALNQQLLKLEKELGTQLFHRSRTDWHPTEAGRIYVEGAQQALQIRRDTYNRINDIAHSRKAELKIGLTPGRGIAMFTAIYPELYQKFTDLSVTPIEMGAMKQMNAIANGEIDIGFVTCTPEQRTKDCFVKIGSEEMVVVVPRVHPVCSKAAPPGEPFSVISLKELEYEPFTLMYPYSTNRKAVDEIFRQANFTPNILMETSSTSSILSLVGSYLCCGVVPSYYIDESDNRIGCFVLPEHPTWDLCIIYRRNSYLTDAEREFIRLSEAYWKTYLRPVQTN